MKNIFLRSNWNAFLESWICVTKIWQASRICPIFITNHFDHLTDPCWPSLVMGTTPTGRNCSSYRWFQPSKEKKIFILDQSLFSFPFKWKTTVCYQTWKSWEISLFLSKIISLACFPASLIFANKTTVVFSNNESSTPYDYYLNLTTRINKTFTSFFYCLWGLTPTVTNLSFC